MRARVTAVCIAVALVASGCSFGGADEPRTVSAQFSRAVQVFPGNSVRVLGVQVGQITEVRNDEGAVEVTFRIDDPTVKLPSDVKATIVPVSLLGERYIELFPAYKGGTEFTGEEIPLARTSVPAEQDELLRSLQDYFGELDPKKVERFVTAAARVLNKNGDDLNQLIDRGTGVIKTLSDKRDVLADLIIQMNTVTQALSTRQRQIAELLHVYNRVARTVNSNRRSLEGTIDGLTEASAELADLLADHRDPLGYDIRALTRTGRTMTRNVDTFVRTGHWAERLFDAASRAMDYERDWLRLGNQGQPLVELLLRRLRDRLVGLCGRLGLPSCESEAFWAQRNPSMFCLEGSCPEADGPRRLPRSPGRQIEKTIRELPERIRKPIEDETGLGKTVERATGKVARLLNRDCSEAAKPRRCRLRKKIARQDPSRSLDQIIKRAADQLAKSAGGSGGSGTNDGPLGVIP